MADTPQAPQPQMTAEEFANKIKTKYPDYKNWDNNKLVSKMLTKYPQYKSQIKAAPAAKAPKAPAGPGAPTRFVQNFNESFGVPKSVQNNPSEAAQGIKMAVQHPSLEWESLKEMGKGMVNAQGEAYNQGRCEIGMPGIQNKVAGSLHMIESGIPFIGPSLVKADNQFASGDKAGAAGTAIGTALQVAGGSGQGAAMADQATQFAKLAVEAPRKAVGETARNYAAKTATKMTKSAGEPGLIRERDTGINVPDRIAESMTRHDVGGVEKQITRFDQKARAASTAVEQMAAQAAVKGYSSPMTVGLSTLIDKLMDNSPKLRQMLDLQQTRSSLWNKNSRPNTFDPREALKLKQDLDDVIFNEGGHKSTSPVAKSAHKLRTAIDQAYDKTIPGWKDMNERASSYIKAKEAMEARHDSAMRNVYKEAVHRMFAMSPEELATTGVGAIGMHESLKHMGVGNLSAYVGTAGGMMLARYMYHSVPSQTFRIALADGLADMLIGQRKSQGPSAWGSPSPAPGGPGPMPGPAGTSPVQPAVGGGQQPQLGAGQPPIPGAPQGGPQSGVGPTPQQTAITHSTLEVIQKAAEKAGISQQKLLQAAPELKPYLDASGNPVWPGGKDYTNTNAAEIEAFKKKHGIADVKSDIVQ